MSEAVVCAFLRDFREHGQRAIAKVRETQPAAYVKLAVLLVPRENKVEHHNSYEGLSTEQIELYIAAIQDRLDRRAGKLIDGEPVEPTAVDTTPPPAELEPPRRNRNRLLQHADSAVGPKPRKRKVPLPPGA